MKRYSMLALALGSALMLTACLGSGDDVPVQAASNDAQLAASANTTSAVANIPFTFSSGVPQFGTATSTTVTFTSSGSGSTATQGFSVASTEGTASGPLSYGSCIFTVTSSTFPSGSPLALGQVVVVNPCEIKLDTSGQVANGEAQQSAVELVLSTLVSADVTVNVAISPTGQITLNNQNIGTVTLSPVTGG